MRALAQHVQAQGRGSDSMLVHMTPREVGGLQALALAHGGTLTLNPKTGLPEAGFLDTILPILAGIGLSFIPIGGPLVAAAITGVGTAAITGDINKGLMAGLGAFGGAGLAGAAGIGAAAAGAGSAAAPTAAALTPAATGVASSAIPAIAPELAGAPTMGALGQTAAAAATPAASIAPAAAPTSTGMFGSFGDAFSNTLERGNPALAGDIGWRTYAGAAGLAAPLLGLDQQGGVTMPKGQKAPPYNGPYKPMPRMVQYPVNRSPTDSSEFSYFSPFNPYPGFVNAARGGVIRMASGGLGAAYTGNLQTMPVNQPVPQAVTMPPPSYVAGRMPEYNYNFRPIGAGIPMATAMPYNPNSNAGYTGARPGGGFFNFIASAANRHSARPNAMASGGSVPLKDGAFVVDARTVSELGNGSSGAGQELLARHGGQPIRGPGDGVSDSIHANVGGVQEARVARDEVKFDPEAVKRMGGGSAKKGASKLYALMNKAKQARKDVKRGQDSGLAALLGR